MNRGYAGFAVALALLSPAAAFAQLVITEVMYDAPGADDKREWVEVRNDSAAPVDLTKLKLADAKGAHKVVAAAGGSSIAPGSYAVIARDPAALGTLPVPVFKSAISFGNESGTVELRSASSTLDSVTYARAMGAAGDGNTLNRAVSGATLTPRSPSPGAPMNAAAIAPAPKASKAPVPTQAATKQKAASAQQEEPEYGAVEEPAEDESTSAAAASTTQIAAVAAVPAGYTWPLAAGALAAFAAIGVAASRHAKRTEWTIIDDTPADS